MKQQVAPRTKRPIITQSGFPLICLGLVLAISAFFFANPFFATTIAPRSEPMLTALFAAAFLTTAGLAFLRFSHPHLCGRALAHPIVFWPAIIALLSLLFFPFHLQPIRTFFGSIETGQGLVWYTAIASFSAAALIIKHIPAARKALLWTAIISTAANTFLTYLRTHYGIPFAPYVFADYTAFYAIFLACICLCLAQDRPTKIIGIGVALLTLLFSANSAAFASAVAALLVLLAYRIVLKRYLSLTFTGYLALGGLVTACLVGITVLGLSVSPDTANKFFGLAQSQFIFALSTIWTRFYMVFLTLAAFADHPIALLHGFGWGSYGDLQTSFLPVDLFPVNALSKRSFWDGTVLIHFHSHNDLWETFLAIGLPGIFCFIALFVAVIKYATPNNKKVAIAYSIATIGTLMFWFQMPSTLALFAFANAAPMRLSPSSTSRWSIKNGKAMLGILASVAILQLAASGIILKTAKNTEDFYAPPLATAEQCPTLAFDYGRGGEHLSRILRSYTRYVMYDESMEDPAILTDAIARLQYLLCLTDDYIASYPDALGLRLKNLLVLSDIAFVANEKIPTDTLQDILKKWPAKLKAFIELAPERFDVAAPYILWQISQGNDTAAAEMSNWLYQHNLDDPVALWFSGLNLLSDPQQAPVGIKRMQKALDMGIDRIIEVDPETKKALLD